MNVYATHSVIMVEAESVRQDVLNYLITTLGNPLTIHESITNPGEKTLYLFLGDSDRVIREVENLFDIEIRRN